MKDETSQSYEGGLHWNPPSHSTLNVEATGFTLRQTNAIDYSKYNLSDPYQATNVGHIAYSGVETIASYRPSFRQQIWLGYTFIHAPPPPLNLISEYAYNYASNKANASYQVTLRQIAALTSVTVVQQTARTAYPLWNLSMSRSKGIIRPYMRVENLANVSYQQLVGVPLRGEDDHGRPFVELGSRVDR